MEKILINLYVPAIDKSYDLFAPKDLNIASLVQMFSNSIQELSDGQYSISGFEMLMSKDPALLLHPDCCLGDYGMDDGSLLIMI